MTITHDHNVKAMAFMNEQSHKLGELFLKFGIKVVQNHT